MERRFTSGFELSGGVEAEFRAVDSYKDGLGGRGNDVAPLHSGFDLGAPPVQLRGFSIDLNRFVQGGRFQIPYRQPACHTGMTRSDMRHAHNVIENPGYPAAMGMTRRALKGLSEDHGASNSISAFMPRKCGSAGVAAPGHRNQLSHDIVDAAAARPAPHVD